MVLADEVDDFFLVVDQEDDAAVGLALLPYVFHYGVHGGFEILIFPELDYIEKRGVFQEKYLFVAKEEFHRRGQYPGKKFTKSSQIISTHLLTVLTKRAIT